MRLGIVGLTVGAGVFLLWAVRHGYSKNFASAWNALRNVGTSSGAVGAPAPGGASGSWSYTIPPVPILSVAHGMA